MRKLFKVLCSIVAVCGVMCLCACGAKDDNTETTTNATTTTVEETSSNVAEEDTTEEQKDDKVTYKIKVVDANGQPIPSAMVQICKDACVPGVTNEDGIAEFAVAEDAGYKASMLQMPEGYKVQGDEEYFYFEDGCYELTITLEAIQ